MLENLDKSSKKNKLRTELIGLKSGKWSITGPGPLDTKKITFHCICECGTKQLVARFELLKGNLNGCKACYLKYLKVSGKQNLHYITRRS